jgi:hypothetical protein
MLHSHTRAIRVFAEFVFRFLTGSIPAVDPSRTHGVAVESLEQRALMSTYYVSPWGDDSNTGTSISKPWKSISKVNSEQFNLGDSILFQGNQTYDGTLAFNAGTGGGSGGFVTVSSYAGRATIDSGSSDGAHVFNTSGIDFENLKFQGSPGSISQYGIVFETTTSDYKRANVKVNNCEITGYNGAGVMIEGDTGNSGFEDVTLTNNSIHGNVQTGIYTYAATDNAIDNVYVGYNQVYDNYGDGTSYVTGSGIQLGDVNEALVEHNSAYLNGVTGGNGGVGIWAYQSNDVTFQYNESYQNHGYRGHDGDGFDFDSDTSNSVMQYNYAYDNDGTGFQLDQWKNDSIFTNDTVQYNIAENNGQRNNYGSIEVWGHVLNSSFIGNTVYISPSSSGGSPSGMHAYNTTIAGLYVDNVTFEDNTIVAAGGLRMVYVPSAETQGAQGLKFVNNTYDSSGSTPNFSYGNNTYYNLSEFESSTGQDDGATFSNAAMPFPAFAAPNASIAGSALIVTASATESSSLAGIFADTSLEKLFNKSIADTTAGSVASV